MSDSQKPSNSKLPSGKRSDTDRIADIVKENERRRELRHFQEELEKRISIAKSGRLAYEQKNLAEAMQNYKRFLQITARAKGVDIKDLHPKLFSEDVRISESILISAIAFDLAKIYDHLPSKDASTDRALYIKILLNFSVGMPFQAFIADNLKKFTKYTPNIKHKSEFERAYKALGGSKACFVATAVYGNSAAPEVLRLRKYRDNVLALSWGGRLFIRTYYAIGPWLARIVEHSPALRSKTRNLLTKILQKI